MLHDAMDARQDKFLSWQLGRLKSHNPSPVFFVFLGGDKSVHCSKEPSDKEQHGDVLVPT